VGSGFSEVGDTRLGTHSTRIERSGDGWRLNGRKFYTTGSLFADWITLGAVDGAGEPIGALVPTKAPGVEILDDWDGFGQSLSASGTARFEDVALGPELIKPSAARFSYSAGFFQLIHLATLAGIGRAAATEAARHVAARERVYGVGNGTRSAEDPQVLQIVGRVRGTAYAARAVVLSAAQALSRASAANLSVDEAAIARANRDAELEVSQSVTVVTTLILDAATLLFDALGASAVRREHGLDRHWRNARTIASHNPRIYHDRTVGEFAVRGAAPKRQVGVGTLAPAQGGKVPA
jgi:alkylation response protein AidB-like acyl-CoA dehydrogenase